MTTPSPVLDPELRRLATRLRTAALANPPSTKCAVCADEGCEFCPSTRPRDRS